MKRRLALAMLLGLWSASAEAARWPWLGDYGPYGASRYNRYIDKESVWAVRGEHVLPLIRAAAALPVRSREEAAAPTCDSVPLLVVGL